MKKSYIILFLVAIVLVAILVWPRGNYKISKIESGNTVILDKGTRVVLIGVENTDKSKEFLENNYKNVKVVLKYDSSSPFDPNHLGADETVHAYVLQKTDGQCINSTILRSGQAGLNTSHLTDSLKVYRAYVEQFQ